MVFEKPDRHKSSIDSGFSLNLMGFEKLTGMKSSIDFGFSLNLMVEQVPGTFSSTSDLAASPELMKTGFTKAVKPVDNAYLCFRTLLKYTKHSKIWNTVEHGIPSPM